jgi:hypothetical protein
MDYLISICEVSKISDTSSAIKLAIPILVTVPFLLCYLMRSTSPPANSTHAGEAPNGYVAYAKQQIATSKYPAPGVQAADPYSGQTLDPSSPWWHIIIGQSNDTPSRGTVR